MSMQAYLGVDAKKKKDHPNEPADIIWDSAKLVNGHALIAGMTGSGKSWLLRKLISCWTVSQAQNVQDIIGSQAARRVKPRVHVMDIHGDMKIEGASSVMFSEQTDFGLNPLRVNSDPHFGGLRKRVQGFINTMNRVMTRLGPKQEAALRNVLFDLYSQHGFDQEDPSTWSVDQSTAHLISDGSDNRLYIDVPRAEKDDAKALGARWEPLKTCWWIAANEYTGGITRWKPKTAGRTHPSISDALRFARRILEISFMGSDQKAITQLEIFSRQTRLYQKKVLDAMRRGQAGVDDKEEVEAELDKSAQKAIESFTEFVNSIKTGRELTDVMKYDSTDVLKSVVDRLENLNSIGVFKAAPPPFDPDASIWHYDLRALSLPERKLFVLFRLEEIFAKGVERGEQDEILDVIVIDEAHIYVDDDPENIMNTIAKEARKFGIALVCASQSPTHYPEDFVSAVGTKIILGIDELFWKGAATKMNLPEEALKWITLQRTMMVQLKEKGQAKNDWRWTTIANN